jgi:hypothetical protein
VSNIYCHYNHQSWALHVKSLAEVIRPKKAAVREGLSWKPRSIDIEHISSEKDGEIKKNPLAIRLIVQIHSKIIKKYPKTKYNDSIVALS